MDPTNDTIMTSQLAPSTPSDDDTLPPFPVEFDCHYITTEQKANEYLQVIVHGVVGLDTEYKQRSPTRTEEAIIKAISVIGGSKKTAIQGLHIAEKLTCVPFPVAWENIGLCLIQIAYGNERILTSPDILKVGVGLINDIAVLWTDLRIDVENLADAGMMAKLVTPETYPNTAFGNVSLQQGVANFLGYWLDKETQTSAWGINVTEEQLQYAASDAMAALQLYIQVKHELIEKGEDLGRPIPSFWYTFNSLYGEPMRRSKSVRGEPVAWSTRDCTWYSGGKFQGYFF
ncbi:ribonuclease H-like domain-containing protein [Mycena rebaudengoi]|nr:ribonuclease H-like domain-containing protein [Mycena rebaudengoi]